MASKVVITGGAGYVGLRLARYIRECHPELGNIVLFDVRAPKGNLPNEIKVVVGDLCDSSDVLKALKGATTVFHLASYGMSDYESMQEDRVYQVNVIGTQNIIQACIENGVERLVYVSTYNTVFDGVHPIHAGTEETCTYVTKKTTSAAYSWTKAEAEQAIIAANGTAHAIISSQTVASGDRDPSEKSVLYTTVIRPGGIWGPGELRHIPRIIQIARKGLLQFVFGDANSVVDWLHIDNLVDSLVLAAQALTAQKDRVAAGKVYFVNDDAPVNNFEHVRPILEGLGYKWPTLRLPYNMVYAIAWLLEMLCKVLQAVRGETVFVPMLCRMEVAKCAVTHYAKCDLAKKELGYVPKPQDYVPIILWYKAHGLAAIPKHPDVTAYQMARLFKMGLALFFVAVILLTARNKDTGNAVGDAN